MAEQCFKGSPKQGAPLMDIIIPVHGQATWLRMCLLAIEGFTRNPYRVILVDNASPDEETLDVLDQAEICGHTVIHLRENKSFSNACNVGIARGEAKVVVILNTDVIVQRGWDTALLQDVSGDKSVGISGARSNYAAGLQGNPGLAAYLKPKYLVFVCVAFRREVYEKLGPLDETTFDGFSCEDLDYSFRALKAGYKLKVSDAYVLHGGSQTLKAVVGDGAARQSNDAKYQQRLIEKHGKDYVIASTKTTPQVLVTSFSAEEMTRVDFMKHLVCLRTGGIQFSYYHHVRSPIHIARQLVADYALAQGFDYVLMLDDDMVQFPPDLLTRFIAHDKDLVSAVAYQRLPPHATCVFDWSDPTKPPEMSGVSSLEGIEHTGLRKVDAVGFSCSLIKTSVFARLKESGSPKFFGNFEKLGEDIHFCAKVAGYNKALPAGAAPIGIYCDTEVIIGHLGLATVVNEDYRKAFRATPQPARAL